MERSVLHLDPVDFPVAAERLRDPSLRGRPVLICRPGARVVPPNERLYENISGNVLRIVGRSVTGVGWYVAGKIKEEFDAVTMNVESFEMI